MEAVLRRNWPEWNGRLQRRTGGWNNTTYFVKSGGRSGVLRVYDTHRDRDKIEFEHAVLQALSKQSLSFRVPMPIRTITGETLAQVDKDSGKYVCLFEYIEGISPLEQDPSFAHSFGEAAGELSAVLATLNLDMTPVYRPYYALQQSYPLCSPEVIQGFCLNPPEPLKNFHEELRLIGKVYEEITDSLQALEELPHQLVHGDLNASNLLVKDSDHSQVAALLDFEFCTLDVRVMEPAVILSGFLGQPEETTAVRDFCQGFSRQIRLSQPEIDALPVLMLLRKVDVFLHFVSRFLEGTDQPHVLQEQVQQIAADLFQLSTSSSWIQEELAQAGTMYE
ncbi:phosphotransferase [Paenibacillus polymyxa]|uniref:phosphotransferase n=1 Tax=Paenibacillus polymyxa TaxID=1406 RepID=UPI0005CF5C07|nr:phosphotransferase [Paenibacillus polymyxa]KAE8558563.1 aminoglycoside phosphotransferase [Paenibacillus polymyxa]KJD38510.1 aminoglycoside phosphotransferase [Paenibacillus polymyxa]MCJ1220240.1 phosphotransferase [Paenibacillus polymyxa]URJ35085.1 phosphotransferase [Paenibacillus polymyxa]